MGHGLTDQQKCTGLGLSMIRCVAFYGNSFSIKRIDSIMFPCLFNSGIKRPEQQNLT
ncbi:hypothetical protein HanIR_Chr00c27g0911121 [Helianthus annuus]|nr:hypothetical protein HanIR_Chr00c27g0911121 [Helianthus annuus]